MVRHTRSLAEALTPQQDEQGYAYELHEETDHAADGGVDGEESDAVEEEMQDGEGYSDAAAEEEGDLNGAEADLKFSRGSVGHRMRCLQLLT